MAALQRLGNASLTPAAKPVSTFLQYDENPQPAKPMQMPKLAQVRGITTLQAGRPSDVQGVNPFRQLDDALGPLLKLYDTGVEMFASDQYRRGQNEILRAAANINRDTIDKSYRYAADNREVDRSNPVAGTLMDQANPFRQAGRINQASQWVASQVPNQMRAQWSRYGADLAKLDPSNPAVTAVQAEVTSNLANAFGLDEFSPGFQQYVVPQINKSWEWLQNKQFEAHVKYQKEQGVAQTTQYLISSLVQGVTDEQWLGVIQEQAARFGITGEPQAMTKKSIIAAQGYFSAIAYNPNAPAEDRQEAARALARLSSLPSGLYVADENGVEQPIPIGIAYPYDVLKAQAASARDMKTLSDAQKVMAEEGAIDDIDSVPLTDLRPGSPALQQLLNKLSEKYPDLNRSELLELIRNNAEAATQFEQSLFDPVPLDNWFVEADGRVGTDWDEATARREFNQLTINATGANLQEARKRWNELKARKAREQRDNLDRGALNGNIEQAARGAVLKLYPTEGVQWLQEARARGQSIVEYLGSVDADKALATQRITSYLQRQIIAAIQKETADKGGALSFTRQNEIGQEIVEKLLKDEETLNRLAEIPEAETEPEAQGAPEAQQQSEAKPAPTVYLPGAAVPEAATKGSQPIYSKEDTMSLFFLVSNNRPIPAQVKRAARAAGMTPGQFILKQFDLHGLETTDEVRQKILRNSNRSMGAENALYAAKPANTPVARSSGVLLDILLGTAPSYSRSA